MPFLGDRVKETTDTTGTGTLDLAGAATGFRAFSDEFASGVSVYYLIVDDPSDPTDYEYGIGTFTAGTPDTLSRDTVLGSSNSDNKVSWSAGTKVVISTPTRDVFERVFTRGADIASASALNVAGRGNVFDVTGTTSITSLAAKGVGSVVILHFDGALTLTHHSTNLVLPGGANIATAAGDIGIFQEYADGDWRCVSYQRAVAKPYGRTFMAVQTLSGQRNRTFSSIPPWATRISLNVWGMSSGGTTDAAHVRIGDSEGIESANYLGSVANASGASLVAHNTGWQINSNVGTAAHSFHGRATLDLVDPATNTWTIEGTMTRSDSADVYTFSGSKALSGALTQVQIGLFGSTDTWDAGSVSGYYE